MNLLRENRSDVTAQDLDLSDRLKLPTVRRIR